MSSCTHGQCVSVFAPSVCIVSSAHNATSTYTHLLVYCVFSSTYTHLLVYCIFSFIVRRRSSSITCTSYAPSLIDSTISTMGHTLLSSSLAPEVILVFFRRSAFVDMISYASQSLPTVAEGSRLVIVHRDKKMMSDWFQLSFTIGQLPSMGSEHQYIC